MSANPNAISSAESEIDSGASSFSTSESSGARAAEYMADNLSQAMVQVTRAHQSEKAKSERLHARAADAAERLRVAVHAAAVAAIKQDKYIAQQEAVMTEITEYMEKIRPMIEAGSGEPFLDCKEVDELEHCLRLKWDKISNLLIDENDDVLGYCAKDPDTGEWKNILVVQDSHVVVGDERDEFLRLLAQGQLISDRASMVDHWTDEEDEEDDECAICPEIVRTPVKSLNARCTHTYCASMCWLSATPPPMTQQHRESEKMNTNLKAEISRQKAEIARQKWVIVGQREDFDDLQREAGLTYVENADLKAEIARQMEHNKMIARQKEEIARQRGVIVGHGEDFDELQRQEALTCVENADLKAEIARQRKIIARWEGWSKSQTITKKSKEEVLAGP